MQFDLRVNDGVPPGTVIANQAVVDTAELPDLLTDGDGNPATGPEPTVVVVGNLQQLRITKNVAVVGGGPALAGATLEYVVQVTNIGDRAGLCRRDPRRHRGADAGVSRRSWISRATLNGSTTGSPSRARCSPPTTRRPMAPCSRAATVTLRFRAVAGPESARSARRVTNTGTVYWNDPTQTASASVSIDVGGITGVGMLNGTAWHDAEFRRRAGRRRARARGLGCRAVSQRRARAFRAHGRERRLSDQRRRAELRDRWISTSCASVRRAPARTRRSSGARYSMTSRTACSGSRDIVVAPGSNLQNLEPADRSERRRVQLRSRARRSRARR